MNMDIRIERVGKGEFFFTGTFFWNIDLDDSVLASGGFIINLIFPK